MFIRNDYYFKAEIDSPLILDCGANIGFATMYFKWLYPTGEIHAFEPDPLTFQLLQKNVLENRFSNVVCQCAAISNVNGEADFYIDNSRPGWIQMSLLPRDFKETVKVRTLSLSSYIFEKLGGREIDFLKLDLEGVEFDVLQELAASGCLRQTRELFIEYHHRLGNAPSMLARFVKILEENGFEYSLDTFYTNRFGNNKFQCINFHARRTTQNPMERS
jgi:FkbM family methyltransferase